MATEPAEHGRVVAPAYLSWWITRSRPTPRYLDFAEMFKLMMRTGSFLTEADFDQMCERKKQVAPAHSPLANPFQPYPQTLLKQLLQPLRTRASACRVRRWPRSTARIRRAWRRTLRHSSCWRRTRPRRSARRGERARALAPHQKCDPICKNQNRFFDLIGAGRRCSSFLFSFLKSFIG